MNENVNEAIIKMNETVSEALIVRIARILETNVFYASIPTISMDSLLLAYDIEHGANALSTMLNYLHDEHHSNDELYD